MKTLEYGLIGEHLGHSFSQIIHSEIADYRYELCELAPEELEGFLKSAGFKGINVTIPYKKSVIPFLDELSDEAKRIGAVNTIVCKGGKLYGYNTDYFGLKCLAKRLGTGFEGKKVLVLGTGGASSAAFAVAEDLGAAAVLKVSRGKKEGAVSYDEAYSIHSDADIIINTTPVGMFPDGDGCPVDISKFTKLSGVIDLIYNPLRTRLVLNAKKCGIPAEGGLYMLVAQAVRASCLFLGKELTDDLNDAVYKKILRMKENIVLTGMPRSGKSTIGRILAEKLCCKLSDTDQLITEKEGRKITDIFAEDGESYFRKTETEIISEVSKDNGKIISVGGGAILSEENEILLKRNGKVIFIDRPLDELLPTDDRPLANDAEKIEKLFEKRYPIYKAKSDISIVNNRSAENAAERIIDRMDGKIKILVMNGPNLNMLGIREPDIYGYVTYRKLCEKINSYCEGRGVAVEIYQSNHEGDLVDKIQEAYGAFDGIVINPGGYTHTSVAIPDAIKAVSIPTVEVHISKVDEREDFRRINYIRPVCINTVAGLGIEGYFKAIDLLVKELRR